MNFKKLSLVALIITAQLVSAQTSENKVALGINFLKNEYQGDYGSGIFDFGQEWKAGLGLSLSTYLSPSFDMGLQGTYGNYGYEKSTIDRFTGAKLDASLFGKYKFNNGYLLSEDSKLSPFVSLGLGFASYSTTNDATPWPTIIVDNADFIVPVGVGLKYQFSKSVALQYQYIYNITNSDVHDQNRSGGVVNTVFHTPAHPDYTVGNDRYGQHLLGLVINLSKAKDTDNDGIADKFDKCMDTPVNVVVDGNGCPVDGDNDGVADYLDKCADTPAGVAVDAAGCPIDGDKDGVADYLDKCPTVAGIAKFNGCPDTDNDGIQDSEDKCPTVAGLAKYDGCPDTDGDGVIDSKDQCPTVAGTLNGCPDRDKDGVADHLDKCPDVAGLISNKGCPEVKKETQKVFDQALHGVQFESGKNLIKKACYPVLDKVVKVMKENESYDLKINGHTDSQGDEALNLTLSQDRAAAVKDYLVAKGIAASRLTSKGFGETTPVADNNTAAGRANNRRVEFKINF